MYRGFNLTLDDNFAEYLKIGRQLHENNQQEVKNKINSFKDSDGNLIASKIVASWFPPIEADIFLSHSHKDSNETIGLAGWLKKTFDLRSFIDSCIWGYSEELLRLIDNNYCLNEGSQTYSYDKRNRSTSHVYMMLSTALTKMINSCECIIFVNTPNSISPTNYIKTKGTTNSPWIYSEIAMTSLIQHRAPEEHRKLMMKAALEMLELREAALNVKYDVDLNHLTPLSMGDLKTWEDQQRRGYEALDALYQIKAEPHG